MIYVVNCDIEVEASSQEEAEDEVFRLLEDDNYTAFINVNEVKEISNV